MKNKKYLSMIFVCGTFFAGISADKLCDDAGMLDPKGPKTDTFALENMKAENVKEIKIQFRAERKDENFDKDNWKKIVETGSEYIKLCKDSAKDDDSFIDGLKKVIMTALPIVHNEKSGIDGHFEIFLCTNFEPDHEKFEKKIEPIDLDKVENIKKTRITFVVRKDEACKDESCYEKNWEEIFNIAHKYAMDCEKSFFENDEEFVIGSVEVIKNIYELAKGVDSITGKLNVSVLD